MEQQRQKIKRYEEDKTRLSEYKKKLESEGIRLRKEKEDFTQREYNFSRMISQ